MTITELAEKVDNVIRRTVAPDIHKIVHNSATWRLKQPERSRSAEVTIIERKRLLVVLRLSTGTVRQSFGEQQFDDDVIERVGRIIADHLVGR